MLQLNLIVDLFEWLKLTDSREFIFWVVGKSMTRVFSVAMFFDIKGYS